MSPDLAFAAGVFRAARRVRRLERVRSVVRAILALCAIVTILVGGLLLACLLLSALAFADMLLGSLVDVEQDRVWALRRQRVPMPGRSDGVAPHASEALGAATGRIAHPTAARGCPDGGASVLDALAEADQREDGGPCDPGADHRVTQ